MNLNRTRHLFTAILLCSLTAALSATEPTATTNTPHRGIASATSYSNDFFDVHVEFPAGWTAMTDDEIVAVPSLAFFGDPIRSLRRGLPVESLSEFPLMLLVNTETGRETQTTANVIVIAKALQGNSAAAMPLVAAREREDILRVPGVKAAGPIHTEVLGGKTFRRFDVTGPVGRHESTRRVYLAESRGYAILIMTTGVSAADEAAIAALLDNFSFTPSASTVRRTTRG